MTRYAIARLAQMLALIGCACVHPLWAQTWAVGDTLVTQEWDSGMTSNLSGWKQITCTTSYGNDYLLSGLQASKDAGSTDQYIAKLVGECARYWNRNDAFVQEGTRSTSLIFSANHKDPGEWVKLGADQYIAGIVLEVDTFNDFVQALYLEMVSQTTPGFIGPYSDPVPSHVVGWGGVTISRRTLRCPDQHVATGVALKYDERKGKIRHFRVYCRPLASR